MSLRYRIKSAALLLPLCILTVAASSAFALDKYATPILSCDTQSQTSITLKVTAGTGNGSDIKDGAPAGVSIQWMSVADFVANGNQWFDSDDPRLCKLSLSGQPTLNGANDQSRWSLTAAGQFELITVGGNIFDETGASGNCLGDLVCSTDYVFRAFAHATAHVKRSDFTANVFCSTDACPSTACVHSWGYYKTHCDEVTGLTLGTVPYTADDVCRILNGGGAAGNILINLAHQLIAAKLNVTNGGGCDAVNGYISDADSKIGSLVVPPIGTGVLKGSVYSTLAANLELFNTGELSDTCPDHCGGPEPVPGSPAPRSWGNIKGLYR